MTAYAVLVKALETVDNTRVTSVVMRRYHLAQSDLKSLEEIVLPRNVKFYNRLLMMLREKHVSSIDLIAGRLPEKVYTYARNAVVALFRARERNVKEAVTENARRRHKGLRPR